MQGTKPYREAQAAHAGKNHLWQVVRPYDMQTRKVAATAYLSRTLTASNLDCNIFVKFFLDTWQTLCKVCGHTNDRIVAVGT